MNITKNKFMHVSSVLWNSKVLPRKQTYDCSLRKSPEIHSQCQIKNMINLIKHIVKLLVCKLQNNTMFHLSDRKAH